MASGAGPRFTWPGGRNFLKGFCRGTGQRKEEKASGSPLTTDVHVQLMNISVAIYLSLHHPAAGATDPRWINIATERSMRHPLSPPATSIRPLVPTTCWLGTLSCSIGFRFSLAVEAQPHSDPGRPPHPSGPSPCRLGMEPRLLSAWRGLSESPALWGMEARDGAGLFSQTSLPWLPLWNRRWWDFLGLHHPYVGWPAAQLEYRKLELLTTYPEILGNSHSWKNNAQGKVMRLSR